EITGSKITVLAGKAYSLNFKVSVRNSAEVGDSNLTVTLYNGSTVVASQSFNDDFEVYDKTSVPSSGYTGDYLVSFDIECNTKHSDGLLAGSDNVLTVELFNRGNTYVKNTEVSLTLPEGITPYNSASSVNAGYITIGSRYTAKFPLTVDSNMESKNYPIDVNISGADMKNSSQSLKKTFYIPVIAGGGTYSTDNINISDVSIPNQVLGGEDFTLSFGVKNQGTTSVSDLKVSVEMPEGIVNKSKNLFSLKKLEKNSTQNYSITMVCPDKTTEKYYSFKITVEPMSGKEGSAISQFAGTLVKNAGGSSKTPQLMVESYDYGGSYVQAGDEFVLALGLYNTNKSHDLQNVKVTVTSDDGTFIPVKSSNSFYVDEIKAKKRAAQSLHMTAKRDAEQKTSMLTVEMSYEDLSGNAFSSKDVISIPVMQEARLVIDDIIAPPELYAAMQTGSSVKFYNMGKTVLNNLRVDVSGDFDTMESNLYYVGNMEGGKSDSFDFSFIPRQAGPMAGTITFIYEDASGQELTFEKPFEFQVMEEMPFDEMDMMPEEPEKKKLWVPIGIGAAVVIGIGGFIFWKKRRQKKLHQEMEIDE
ncbi:MAG: NEW3 domain-containing protein, partial [Anaerovorax sp.]|nr:NEW3 domain-containing protein [Anaerovorax sp.]